MNINERFGKRIKEKRKALEYISIPLEINIKEIGLEINLMEKVFYYQ